MSYTNYVFIFRNCAQSLFAITPFQFYSLTEVFLEKLSALCLRT